VSGDTKAHLKSKLDELAKEMQNPFKHIRDWIKGEMMNLDSLIHAISEMECCTNRKQQAIKKMADLRDTNQKLAAGKFTIKGMFKSKENKSKYQAEILDKIAQKERDIDNWDSIKKILIVHLATEAIPEFKTAKIRKYITAMQGFSKDELNNANQ